jgi:predicted AAA+ superfamily ATPase
VPAGYLPRLVDGLLTEILGELPAVLLVGPRATGKTTTAIRHARTVVRLDRKAEAAAFEADPDVALRGLPEPVLLDEWQAVPGVLGAVKRAVDDDSRPGRFLLTGSVRADLDAETWPGTGRLVRVPMFGLTVAELRGRAERAPFFDLVASRGAQSLMVPSDPPNLRDYVDLALQGGFPEPALTGSPKARTRWLDSYVEQLVTRDAELADGGRDPERLRRYFEALVLNTAGVAEAKALYDAAGITRVTAIAYDRLLMNLHVLQTLPAWATNRLKRLVRAPKRYVVDPSLIGATLAVDTATVFKDGDLLGRLLDTFVVAQLRAELPMCSTRPRLHHLRQEQGRHEVDVVAELSGHRVIAVEIKANAAPGSDDAQHLRWLRDQIGDRFLAGVVMHTGPRVYQLDERIMAAPICTLWT